MDRKFEPSDLEGVDMVLTAVDDPEASTQIWKLCKEKKIAANIADVPPECDFYFGSVHRDGPLQIMVSTNGNGPKLASIVRKQIASTLPSNIGAAIQNVGILRKKLRKLAPSVEEGPKRMQWYVSRNHYVFYLHLVGCPKSVSHGAWMSLLQWTRKKWKHCLVFIIQARFQPLNKYVWGMIRLILLLTEALVGGKTPILNLIRKTSRLHHHRVR